MNKDSFSRAFRLAVACAVSVFAVGALAAPAAAHSDEGVMTVVSADAADGLAINVEVGIVYENDDHLAEEAEVSAIAVEGDTRTEPVTLERVSEDSAVYGGSIEVPHAGEWTVEIESANPTSSATATVTVEDAVEDTPETTSTTAVLTDDDVAQTQDNGDTDDSESVGTATEDEDQGDGSDSTWVIVALIVVGTVVVGGGAYFVLRNREAR